MKIDKIIFSLDSNPDYQGFWEVNSEICKKHLGIEPVLFKISDEESDFYKDEFGTVKCIKKVPDIDTGLQAQIYRMYGTKYFMDEVCLIGDIDLLIFNKDYITKNIQHYSDENSLVIMCSDAYDSRRSECVGTFTGGGFRYPITYSFAKGRVFSEIIKNNISFEEFATIVNLPGWQFNSDEIYFAFCIAENSKINVIKGTRGYSSSFYCPNRIEKIDFENAGQFQRINLDGFLNLQTFIDCHCPKPFSKYKDVIEKIKNNILNYES